MSLKWSRDITVNVFLDSVKNVSVIALTAYPLTWSGAIKRSVIRVSTQGDSVVLGCAFGLLSVCGNWTTTEVFNGALLNSGLIGPVVGGIIAGPVAGILSGLIGGFHRLTLGGFTMMPDFIATILAGLVGGAFYWRLNQKRMTFTWSFGAGLLASMFGNLLILAMAEPRILAVTFVKWTGLTSTLVNGIGTGVFISIVHNVQSRQHLIGINYAEKATEIAQRTLPVIKGTLEAGVARQIVDRIYEAAIADAVAITDGDSIIAFAGIGAEHHAPGSRDLELTKSLAGHAEEIRVANTKREISCRVPDCPHDAVLIVPLLCGNEQIWFLHVYKIRDAISPPDIKLVTGIANLLSLQARLENQAQLLARAEYAALRSQVNPHFLFNALSAIKLQIRENPGNAQQLLLALASFFRRTLETNEDLIPLSEEMKCVEVYLTIQEARFGDRLQVIYDVSPECLPFQVPSFVVQPLIENCFNHGFSASGDKLIVKITGRYSDGVFKICIEDNGSGIPKEVIEAVKADRIIKKMGVGLTNVHRRLKSIYGQHCTFFIENKNPGAAVVITIQAEGKA